MSTIPRRRAPYRCLLTGLTLAATTLWPTGSTVASVVQEPVVNQVAQCHYYRNVSRFNTCTHGAIADDAAVTLQVSQSGHIILIDGSALDEERPGIEIRRAERARDYLVYEKGVDPCLIVLRWNRVSRQGLGKWGGSMRILALPYGDLYPDFEEGDLSWQVATQ